jgi:synaptic vesicle membrane protein VAT-1
MEKIVIHRRGGYDRLRLERHVVPALGPQDVHVRVHAAGINYADCIVRMGLYSSAKEYVGWPITPGFEVAGTVVRTGDDVAELPIGTEVIALTRFGGYATDVVVPGRQVFARPRGLSMEQAASFPAVFLTAYHALVELARPKLGAHVLVHSAAGGVGGALVQIARVLGCHVVGVVGGPHKVEVAAGYGAHAVIDSSREPLWHTAELHAPAGYDVVLDANGVSTLAGSLRHLAPMGRLVVYGFASMLPRGGTGRLRWLSLLWNFLRTPRISPFELTQKNRSVMGFNLSYLFDHTKLLRESMDQLTRWVEDGRLRALPVRSFPLARAGEAQRLLESGGTVGKLVLVPEAGEGTPR